MQTNKDRHSKTLKKTTTKKKTTAKQSNLPDDPKQYYSKRELLLDAAHGCIYCVFNGLNQVEDIDNFDEVLKAVAEEHEDRERRAGKI